MNGTHHAVDLERLRAIAEEGRRAPLLGGRYLAWWGGLLALAYLLHYSFLTGLLPGGGGALGWLWVAFAIVGLADQQLLARGEAADRPGRGTVGNRVELSSWQFAGAVLAVYFLALAGHSVVTGAVNPQFGTSVPLVFAVYAVALGTTGVLGRSRLLVRAGGAAIAGVALAAWYALSPALWLIAAGASLLTALLPGLLLLRAERAADAA
ncbi:MAG: hypothetical protein ACX93N_00470 [Pseudohaliea sp.]